jgi:WD40 repeat protein
MASKAQSRPAVEPTPPPSSSRRWLLLALLLLLLIGGGVGLVIAMRGNSDRPDNPNKGLQSGGGTTTEDEEVCADDKDPKYLEPLAFGEPIKVKFDRGPLDALKDKEIPSVEVYPWQPKELVAVLGEHRMRGTVFALSKDGKTLAVSAGDGFIRFGEIDTLHEKHILTCPAWVRLLEWSRDGKTLAVCGGDNIIRLYDVTDLEKIPQPVALEAATRAIGSMSWSGDDKYLIGGENVANRSDACVWDIEKKKIVNRLVHTGPVTGVAFSPVAGDYRALTSGGREDARFCLWDGVNQTSDPMLLTRKPAKAVEYRTDAEKGNEPDGVGGVGFSPDGKRALSSHSLGIVRLWDIDKFEKGKETHTLKDHVVAPPLALFSPDGKYVASARFKDGSVKLWNAADGSAIRSLGVSGGLYGLRFLPDTSRVVFAGTVGYDANIHVHEVETGKEILPPTGHLGGLSCVATSPDGKLILSGSGDASFPARGDIQARLWDISKVAQRSSLSFQTYGVGFSPDVKQAYYFGPSATTLSFSDVSTGAVSTPKYDKAHGTWVLSGAITADGRYAVTGGAADGKVMMWQLRDGRQVREFDLGAGTGSVVTVAPDMRRAIRLSGGKAQLLHLRCQKSKHDWNPGPVAAPFLPDGKALFLGAATSPVWTITHDKVEEAGKDNLNLTGMGQAHVSADGKRVAAILGGRVAVFEVETGKEVWDRGWTPPAHFYGVRAVALTADGGHLVTANGDGTVYVIKLP